MRLAENGALDLLSTADAREEDIVHAQSASDRGKNKVSSNVDGQDEREKDSMRLTVLESYSISIAKHPYKHFCISLTIALVLGAIGMLVGNFTVAADNSGWLSRGTEIANQFTQWLLVHQHREALWRSASTSQTAIWDELTENVQPGWQIGVDSAATLKDDASDSDKRTRLLTNKVTSHNAVGALPEWSSGAIERPPPSGVATEAFHRRILQEAEAANQNATLSTGTGEQPDSVVATVKNMSPSNLLSGCDASWYFSPSLHNESRLWPVWRIESPHTPEKTRKAHNKGALVSGRYGSSILNANSIHAICTAEQKTQNVLVENNACFGCEESKTPKCLPPFSIVLLVRAWVDGGFSMDCDQLASAWETRYYTQELHGQLVQSASDLHQMQRHNAVNRIPDFSSNALLAPLLDIYFGSASPLSSDDGEVPEFENRLLYSSSIFATREEDVDLLFSIRHQFSRATQESNGLLTGAYDTQDEDFTMLAIQEATGKDMVLAIGSAVFTFIAMVIHTRSMFLSTIGLLQVVLSFPLAYFVYTFVGQLQFFPFLNFIGLFVVFALGADDVFVAVDKWKNARKKVGPTPDATQVAVAAFPEALGAMFCTSLTTAVAFFASAACPVVRVPCFRFSVVQNCHDVLTW
jgi:hypothetical protein